MHFSSILPKPFGGSPMHFSSILPKPFAFLKLSPFLLSPTCLALKCTLNSTGAPWILTQKESETHCRDLEFTIWFSCTLKSASVVPDCISSDIWTLLLKSGLEACCGTSVSVCRGGGGGIDAAFIAAFSGGKS